MRFVEEGVSIFYFAIFPDWDGVRKSRGEASILFLHLISGPPGCADATTRNVRIRILLTVPLLLKAPVQS